MLSFDKASKIVKKISANRKKILFARNKQYSSDNDFTANFIDVSNIAKSLDIQVEPDDVARILAILKMVRDANAKKSGKTLEERYDHLLDLHNYIDLAHLCEVNKSSKEK